MNSPKGNKKIITMCTKYILLSLTLCLISQNVNAQTFSKETILISTPYGNMKVKLFNETPQHKQNFLKLVTAHFYDSLLFHRVIEHFMIQGGDPDSKHAKANQLLGEGDLDYTIPAEFIPTLCHQKGMLCAARNSDDVNPTKASSACQFYIVQGKIRDDQELALYEKRVNKELVTTLKENILNQPENKVLNDKLTQFKSEKNNDSLMVYLRKLNEKIDIEYEKTPHYSFPPEHKLAYKTIGGTPSLDQNYTIFGKVIEGLEVIDKIAAAATNSTDRPLADIRMMITLLPE